MQGERADKTLEVMLYLSLNYGEMIKVDYLHIHMMVIIDVGYNDYGYTELMICTNKTTQKVRLPEIFKLGNSFNISRPSRSAVKDILQAA